MKTKIMAIINTTSDSFYDKSRFYQLDQALKKAEEMIQEGADYLDIGGCSTRPGSESISIEEELSRTLPLITLLKKNFSIPLSIDTYHYEVAKQAIEAGATFINDITGLQDPKMRDLVIRSKLPCCINHILGTPKTMQDSPVYPRGVVLEIKEWLSKQVELFLKEGGEKHQIYLDPGIGFGKTVEDNLIILQELDQLQELGFPLLVGISRKSFIQKITKRDARGALAGTLALNTLLVQKNVDILRVHDVAEHKDIITLLNASSKVKALI